MSDGYVQVLPDNTGKRIDTSELTRNDTTVVERQRVVIADPAWADRLAGVGADGALSVSANSIQIEMLGQLKRIAMLLEILTGEEVSLDDAD